MKQDLIFLPMGALAIWTFVVLLIIPFRRFAAARRGLVKAADFKFGESTTVPGEVSIPNRNYMNLLEVPLLFLRCWPCVLRLGKGRHRCPCAVVALRRPS